MWSFAWPANRRVMYNRASARPHGQPRSERKIQPAADAPPAGCLRPGEFSRLALEALAAAEGRQRRRKRDQTPDAIGLSLKRAPFEQAVAADPEPMAFESWLLAQAVAAPAPGPLRAIAAEILEEYRFAAADPSFRCWLEEGAHSADAEEPEMSGRALHANAVRVQASLEEAGLQVEVVEFAESTRSAAEAAAAIGTTVAQIAKSLLFLADDRPLLVIASGSNRVSMTKLADLAQAAVRRADADTVKRVTGFPVGGVPPLGHASPLRIMVDRDLLGFDEIWAAAGTPNAVFRVAPAELARATAAEIVDVREE